MDAETKQRLDQIDSTLEILLENQCQILEELGKGKYDDLVNQARNNIRARASSPDDISKIFKR